LYKWYELNVLLPFIDATRAANGLEPHTRAVLIKDGEYEQVGMYKDPAHLAALEAKCVDVSV